jgi:hypothetical protein
VDAGLPLQMADGPIRVPLATVCQHLDNNLKEFVVPVTGPDFISLQTRDLERDELRAQLTGAGLHDEFAGFLSGLDETIATEPFSRVGDDLTRLIGRPTTRRVEGLTAKQAR